MGGERFGKGPKSGRIEFAGGRVGEIIAQLSVLGEEFVDEGFEFSELACGREEVFLFCVEVITDFLPKMLFNLGLPCFQFSRSRKTGPVDAHTQSECVLVLSGKGDEIFVA